MNNSNFFIIGYGKKIFPLPSPIVNGDLADEDEFRYIVAIRQREYDFYAAGSILDSRWILTARHVVVEQYDDPESDYFNISQMDPVFVYPKYDNNLTHFYRKVPYPVKNLFCYPFPDDNDVFSSDADLALLQLEYPIPLGNESFYKFVKIDINLQFLDFDRDRIDLIAAGWGSMVPDQEGQTNYLRKAKYKSEPVNLFETPEYRPYQQFMMNNPRQGICDGDSGGPIVMRDSNGQDILVGIVSYAPFECE